MEGRVYSSASAPLIEAWSLAPWPQQPRPAQTTATSTNDSIRTTGLYAHS